MRLAVELHGIRVGTIDGDARTFDFLPSPEAIDNLKSLGYRQVPVVMADNEHWSGFRPDKIATLRTLSAVGG